jgi:mRNA-degrading endonuclease toxin of MazEF toxin-antitoxin module
MSSADVHRSLIRGEIRWYTVRLPDKRRPVLVLTRDEVIDHLNEIIVAPVTRTIRGLRTEVLLSRWASEIASALYYAACPRSVGPKCAGRC